MAHLWVRDSSAQWAVLPLDGEAVNLAAHPPAPLRAPFDNEEEAGPAVILARTNGDAPAAWVLLAAVQSDVWVNGMPLWTGIHVLADRDEIRVGEAGAVFFSTETLPVIEKFSGGERSIFCPRCKLPIEPQSDAVRCPHPHCGVWHHQLADRPCFTYDEKCAACGGKSQLNAGYQWIPEEP